MEEKKNMNAGHRQRLLETILDAGLDKVSNVQALEFILTYVIPRCDTNELAHRLLDKFGTAADVLNADWEYVAEVEGMGETSAKKLRLFVEILITTQNNNLRNVMYLNIAVIFLISLKSFYVLNQLKQHI